MSTGNDLLHRVADRLDGPTRDELLRLGMPEGDLAAMQAWALEWHRLTKSPRQWSSKPGRPPTPIATLSVIAAAYSQEFARGLSIRAANAAVADRLDVAKSAGATAFDRLIGAMLTDYPAASFEWIGARALAYLAEAASLLAAEEQRAEEERRAAITSRRDARHARLIGDFPC